MRLTHFSVTNYRSILSADKINLQQLTVIIGKNNEGKSNLIKALCLAMNIINDKSSGRVNLITRNRHYNWNEDFPISLQASKRLSKKVTEFRLDFEMSEEEVSDFSKHVGSSINSSLPIVITFNEHNEINIDIVKRGRKEQLQKNVNKVCEFISNKIAVQYIPAIRSMNDAYGVISDLIEVEFDGSDDEKYREAVEYIANYQNEKLVEISERIKEPLSRYIPNIKNIHLRSLNRFNRTTRYMYNRDLSIEMDDGVLTPLSHKGDGIKSLTAMAILSETHAKSRIIIIDEPENHLHPEANHFLKRTFHNLSEENQVIISTHNPIFVNRVNTSSNIIVNNGEAKPAHRIDEIRKHLGVMVSDNLMYSEYVIVVEGISDKIALQAYLEQDQTIWERINSNQITIRPIGGVNNLKSEIYNLERYLSNYLVLLDYDESARQAVQDVKKDIDIPDKQFKYFRSEYYDRNSELEDLYHEDLYRDLLKDEYQIDITHGKFKDKTKKWSDRIKNISVSSGCDFTDSNLDELKVQINKLISSEKEWLSDQGRELLSNIKEKILKDIDSRG